MGRNPMSQGSSGSGLRAGLLTLLVVGVGVAFILRERATEEMRSPAPEVSVPLAEQGQVPASPSLEQGQKTEHDPSAAAATPTEMAAESIAERAREELELYAKINELAKNPSPAAEAAPKTGVGQEAKVIAYAPSCAPAAQKLWYDATYKVYRSELRTRYPAAGLGRYPCLRPGVWHQFPSGDGRLKVIVHSGR